MRQRIFALLALAAVLVGLAAPPAVAEDSTTLKRIVDSGKLRVGTSGTQPPFSVKSKEGTLIGYEIDLARLLAGAMGVEPVFVEKPFGQLMDALKKGEVDVVMSGLTMTPRRNLEAAFVGPYIVSGKSILTKSETLAAVNETEEINMEGITLTALSGSTSEAFVKALMPKAKLVKTEDYDQAVQMVLEDKASAMVADFPICALSVLRHQDKGLVTLTEPLTIEPIGIALPPGDSLLLNMVENYLAALAVSDLLTELEAKWFEDASWLIHLP